MHVQYQLYRDSVTQFFKFSENAILIHTGQINRLQNSHSHPIHNVEPRIGIQKRTCLKKNLLSFLLRGRIFYETPGSLSVYVFVICITPTLKRNVSVVGW